MNYPAMHVAHRDRAAELLARYPGVSEDEAREILQFLHTGRHLAIGLLSRDDRLRPNLESFLKDHEAQFGVSWREGVGLIGGILVLLIMAWLIWAAFAEAAFALGATV